MWAAQISGAMSPRRRAVGWRLTHEGLKYGTCIVSPSCVQNFEVVPRLVETFVRSWLKIPRKSGFLVILRGYGTSGKNMDRDSC
jgi:hypothetical protein